MAWLHSFRPKIPPRRDQEQMGPAVGLWVVDQRGHGSTPLRRWMPSWRVVAYVSFPQCVRAQGVSQDLSPLKIRTTECALYAIWQYGVKKKIIYEWPHPLFHPLCRQYSALSTAVRTSPRNISVSLLWARVRAPPFLLFLIWPMRVEAVQRKAHECDSSKDTLVSHGIPLRTKLARFFPNTNPLFPSFFSSLPFAVPTPDSRAIFPNPKHLIEQLGFLTCGLICSLNTWLIQKSRNSWGFFFSPPFFFFLF